MNICFIVPPKNKADRTAERLYGGTLTDYRETPLALLYVAAILEEEGHKVTLKDFTDNNSQSEFREYIEGARHGLYIIHTALLAERIDTTAIKDILTLTETNIILFGPHPTLKPKDFLIDRRVYVARGEAEFIIQNIVHAINRNRIVDDIKGISFLKMGEMVETESVGIIEDLDRLLPPLRHLIDDKDDYFNPSLKGGPVAPILTSRGSSADAISLAREIEWRRFNDGRKPPVIFRTPKSIAEEFENIKGLGYKAVSVIDDLFLSGGKERVLDICRCLKVVGLPFAIISRCDMILDEEMVAALRNAGCEHVELIIESMDTDTVGRAIELLSKYHIEATANITFGSSPSETTKSMTETIKKVSELPINYCAFKVATPLHPNLSRKDLERAVKRANRKFYLKPSRIWFQLKKIDSLKALKDLIITCWRVIK